MLSYNETKRFYDAFGKKQDRQFYETAAIDVLVKQGQFGEANEIVEFGCGTGKLASRLLQEELSDTCRYTGVDISQTMVVLFRQNTRQFSDRVRCIQNEGKPIIAVEGQTADRFISTYVLDLLTDGDMAILLSEVHRVLLPGGYLCLASLTHGNSFSSHIVELIWNALYQFKPSMVGGCRPINLTHHLQKDKWVVLHQSVVVSFGIPSEVVIAKRL